MRAVTLLLALRLMAAGAQGPQELLDRFVATGADSDLSAAVQQLQTLPRSHGTELITARLRLLEGKADIALAEATRLNRNMPDDLDTYALIVDSALVLGRVDEAERAAQWMLNLRPEDVRSLMRGAAVREALKDHEGALQMLADALARTARTDVAARAAIGAGMARANLAMQRREVAVRLLDQIDALIPGYKPAQMLRHDVEVTQ